MHGNKLLLLHVKTPWEVEESNVKMHQIQYLQSQSTAKVRRVISDIKLAAEYLSSKIFFWAPGIPSRWVLFECMTSSCEWENQSGCCHGVSGVVPSFTVQDLSWDKTTWTLFMEKLVQIQTFFYLTPKRLLNQTNNFWWLMKHSWSQNEKLLVWFSVFSAYNVNWMFCIKW